MKNITAIVGATPSSKHGECFIWNAGARGTVIAVDAGGTAAVGAEAGALRPEILILSHDDSDHIGGATRLIAAAGASLKELWIPAEWAILIEQVAETSPELLTADANVVITAREAAQIIASEIITPTDGLESAEVNDDLLGAAEGNLNSWDAASINDSVQSLASHPFYGARDLDEIIERVKRRSSTLIKILKAARENGVQIRLFSIDLALASSGKLWETEGRRGTVTLANAAETSQFTLAGLPPGLQTTYALTGITVQNRRALSTLLWRKTATPKGAVVIWSDTDGNWLDGPSHVKFSKVIRTIVASSAPHHASSNTAHDMVWTKLDVAPNDLVMINAGGASNQGYRPEYTAMKAQRSCTWCRPNATTYQPVKASFDAAGNVTLHGACREKH